MGRKSNREFYYFIIDNDQKLFNCLGPISDDTEYNRMVVQGQKSGRQLTANACPSDSDIEENKYLYINRGYTLTKELLINRPIDRSNEYSGSLPKYAQNADRNKIVRFLCRNCRATVFGEMTTNYPGQDKLKDCQLGEYEARCLKCGEIAKDPYNWFR